MDTTKFKKHDRIRDTTSAGKTPPSRVHSDSARLHSDSTMNMSPTDSTGMHTPTDSTGMHTPTNHSGRTPPR